MTTLNSGKKIEALNGITEATIKFMVDIHENMKDLKLATGDIRLSLFDKVHNGVSTSVNAFNGFAEELSSKLSKIANEYAERPGFGATAKTAFEDCATNSNRIKGAITQAGMLEMSDDLHENATEDTIKAFVKSLREVLGARGTYIQYIATAVKENTEADTAEIYNQIGSGVEKITNGFALLFNEYSDELKKFGISLEEINASIKSNASNIAETGATVASQIGSHDGDLV